MLLLVHVPRRFRPTISLGCLYTETGIPVTWANTRKLGKTMDDIAQRCIEIIAKSKNIPADSVALDNTFDALNIDSLDKINISFEVEEAFAVEIPDEALGTIKTVGDMVRGVSQLRESHQAAPVTTN